jgi:hypothetical protein
LLLLRGTDQLEAINFRGGLVTEFADQVARPVTTTTTLEAA